MWKLALLFISGAAAACGICLTISAWTVKGASYDGKAPHHSTHWIIKTLCGVVSVIGYTLVLVFLAREPML